MGGTRWTYGYFIGSGWGVFPASALTPRGTADDSAVVEWFGSSLEAASAARFRNSQERPDMVATPNTTTTQGKDGNTNGR